MSASDSKEGSTYHTAGGGCDISEIVETYDAILLPNRYSSAVAIIAWQSLGRNQILGLCFERCLAFLVDRQIDSVCPFGVGDANLSSFRRLRVRCVVLSTTFATRSCLLSS